MNTTLYDSDSNEKDEVHLFNEDDFLSLSLVDESEPTDQKDLLSAALGSIIFGSEVNNCHPIS